MNNVDFHCRRYLDGDSAQAVLLREVEIEPRVKVDCVPKFSYLGDTLGSMGGVEEATRARVRCACSRSYLLSQQLMVHHIVSREKIYRACVQSVLTYGTEIWVMMKAENLHILERTECMMVTLTALSILGG